MTAQRKQRNTAWLAAAMATAGIVGALVLAAIAPPAQAAGRAEVRYVEPERFTDAGRTAHEREQALAALTAGFERLSARLPDGQTLRVEVLDVDLAGDQDAFGWSGARVMRGRADVPRLTLRWTLSDGSGTLRGGEDRLSDPGYLSDAARLQRPGGELPYESRMLERWFGERVAVAR